MIKKNYKDVGFVYKGTQVIDKIYKGTDLVFEQGYTREQTGVPPIITSYQAIGKNLKDYKIYGNSIQGKLPSEYQQVGYIESTGTQYIDTGIKLNQDSKIVTEIQLTNNGSQPNAIFGSRTSSTENNFECVSNLSSSVGIRIDFQSYETNRLTTEFNNEKNYIVISKTLMQIGERTKRQISYTDFETPYNCYIFYVSGENIYGQKAQMRLYNFKIYQNDVLIKDFIPCYRKSDNEIGLYDTVNNVFYTNQGTGEFTVGANAPTPITPIEIESVGDKTKNLFNYKTASTYKGSFDNNGVFHATDNDNRDNLVYKIQLYNGNTMVTNSSKNISITGTGTYRITSPELIQSGTTRIRFANNGTSIEFSINCDIDGSQFVGQYASIVFTVDDATVGASVISDIMFYVGNEPFDYEPYGYKIPVIVGSDNLATNLGFGWYSGANQKFTISYDFKRCTAKIKPNTTYTISKKNASNRFVVITSELEIAPNVSYKRVVLAEQNTNRTQYTFTTREDENYLFFGYYRGTDETEIELAEEEMMIVEGSTAPSKYIPYYNETTNIYLDEPLRKIGDYLDYIDFKNQKVFRNVIVNDDTGTQTIENSYTGTTDSSGTSISLPNIPTIKGTTVIEIDTKIQPSNMYIKYKGK